MVSIPGQNYVSIFLRLPQEDMYKGGELGHKVKSAIPQIKARVQNNLVISTASRMESSPHIDPIFFYQPGLNAAVDIFFGWGQAEISQPPGFFDLLQTLNQQPGFPPGDNLSPG
jgi:hypothetical protein